MDLREVRTSRTASVLNSGGYSGVAPGAENSFPRIYRPQCSGVSVGGSVPLLLGTDRRDACFVVRMALRFAGLFRLVFNQTPDLVGEVQEVLMFSCMFARTFDWVVQHRFYSPRESTHNNDPVRKK